MYKLIIYDEKGETREFDLLSKTCRLGRNKKNDIFLNDQKVSRSHAQIKLDPDGRLFIEDLNSKEGTMVNGESIHEKTTLKDGDEIAISSFAIEVKKWTEGMETLDMGSSEEEETLLSGSGTDLGPDGTIKIDSNDFDDSELPRHHKLLIISDKRFGEEYLLDKPALMIGSSASGCDILIDEKEISDEHARVVISHGECILENLATAKRTLVNGKAAKKNIPLKKGDCIEIGSVLFRFIDRDEVVQKEELKSRARPKGLGKNKKKPLLMALVFMSAILVLFVLYKPQKGPSRPKESVVQPKPKARPDPVSSKAAKTEKAPEEKKSLPEKDLSVKQEPEKIPDENVYDTVSSEEEGNRLIESAIEDYLRGKTNNAFGKLNAVLKLDLENESLLKQKASGLLGDLKNILGFFHNGHIEYNNNQIEKALAIWSKGLILEEKVVGKKISHDSGPVRNIIADREAREARRYFESGDFSTAHKFCEKALAIYPKHKDSLEISNLIYIRAKKLYGEGYIIKNLDPGRAVLIMKEVLGITSPGSEYYKKANSIITGIKH